MIWFLFFFFVSGTAILSKIFLLLIQEGQMLEAYTNNVIKPLIKDGRHNLAKIAGYCEICFTYWFSNLIFLLVFLPFVVITGQLKSVALGMVLFLFYSGFCLVVFSVLRNKQII